nr:alpha-L-fucosidase [Opitutus sp. ER46]
MKTFPVHPARQCFRCALLALLCSAAIGLAQIPSTATPLVIVSTTAEPVAPGKFTPDWESLKQYRVPTWFRDAKFGIWAHWGPQCQPERGDWYAREMYSETSGRYRAHVAAFGHPSKVGFKDVIHAWRAENWRPDDLLRLYARAGAKYFFALANHHDNFDNWDSKYQPWNSVNLGPRKDLIAGWAAAARRHGLKFGVSVHAAHAWSWLETAQGADATGPLAGVPYDGKLTKADGKGTWWEGYDPQDLYAQNHPPSPGFAELKKIHERWNWDHGVTLPDQAYCEKFYNRTIDLINKYQPDLIYFDDTALPLWPVSDAGLKIAAHFYNSNDRWRGDDGVMFNKILDGEQRRCMAWDVERGSSNEIEPNPWQTDTCIGSWHYDRGIFDRHGYKTARTVVHTLIDVVSKNGNLLLSIPVRGDGTIDDDELEIVRGIGDWMQVNQEAIHGTRPWQVFGEGPQMASVPPLSAQGFNEGKAKPFTAEDVRFTTKGEVLYAIVMGTPSGPVTIKSLGTKRGLWPGAIAEIAALGSTEKLTWSRTDDALVIEPPRVIANGTAVVFKITPRR